MSAAQVQCFREVDQSRIPAPSWTREVMVRFSGEWFFLRTTDADVKDRIRLDIWKHLPEELYSDGLPSYECKFEMRGIPRERMERQSMGKDSKIAWTDHTFNGWWGCTPISPGCANCYATEFDKRLGGDHFGRGKARRTFGDKHWGELTKWNIEALRDGVIRKVFVESMGDIMDDEAPHMELDRLFRNVDLTRHLVYLFLTKRPENYSSKLPVDGFNNRNVWVGASTENQEMYNRRWPILAALRRLPPYRGLPFWINVGPALGPVTLRGFEDKPDWVAFEGESGDRFRQMEWWWAENLLEECREFGIPFYMKQMAARIPARGKELIPPHLQVHEFPVRQ